MLRVTSVLATGVGISQWGCLDLLQLEPELDSLELWHEVVSPLTVCPTQELFTLVYLVKYHAHQAREELYGCKHQSDRQLFIDYYNQCDRHIIIQWPLV